ncbi:MAG: hypothetical protein P4L99_21530 [Chthoniobacter sp.]|nr:hypothetical protein [Chthoniobacter sp.]
MLSTDGLVRAARAGLTLGAALAVLLCASVAGAQRAPSSLTDGQVREQIIKDSIASYNATGHPCACPYQVDRAGHSCGRRSAYSRPGGAAPLCYPQDVTAGMVADWKKAH